MIRFDLTNYHRIAKWNDDPIWVDDIQRIARDNDDPIWVDELSKSCNTEWWSLLSWRIVNRLQVGSDDPIWIDDVHRISRDNNEPIVIDRCWSDCTAEWWNRLSWRIIKELQETVMIRFELTNCERMARDPDETILIDRCWNDCTAEWRDTLVDDLSTNCAVHWWDNFDYRMLKWLYSRMKRYVGWRLIKELHSTLMRWFWLTNVEMIVRQNDRTIWVDELWKNCEGQWWSD
jgi:hypothetical protein